MKVIIQNLRRALRENADPEVRESTKRFFKEEIKTYGLKSAVAAKIGKEAFSQIKNTSKAEIFALCDELWRSRYLEETSIAADWSHRLHKQFEPADFAIFEAWIAEHVTNWAACDTFCTHTMGTFLVMYPEHLPRLKIWAASENRWVRRAAAVSLILPAKKGLFLPEILEMATILLLDADDMVQKGYGWMLKVAADAHLQPVFDFVLAHRTEMPRTSLRYAIEKMPKEMKEKAMRK